jgi:RHS repeat-associated protein
MKKYYYAGATRVAMRTGTGTGMIGLQWLLENHLGSTNVILNSDGTLYSRLTYKPWGETRAGVSSTTFKYTGQRQEKLLGGDEGLYFYGSRWYDDALGRFIQPDSIIPDLGNSQSWDRYAYVQNNPVRFIDPSGNKPCYFDDSYGCGWLPKNLQGARNTLKSDFGITLKNGGANWNFGYSTELMLTVMEIDYRLDNTYGLTNAFRDSMGKTTIISEDYPPGNYYGETDGSVITFYGHLSPEDMIHELGHRINNAANQGLTNLLDDPSYAVFDMHNKFVTGNRGNGYDRGGGNPAPQNGYRSDLPCPYQCHPRSMDASGNTANEEWADMFMNFIGNTYADNPAGNALYNWTTTNLASFIK